MTTISREWEKINESAEETIRAGPYGRRWAVPGHRRASKTARQGRLTLGAETDILKLDDP